MKKVVLAYSGGLDTSIIIAWLKETYGYEVICVAGDVGQGEELEPLRDKAIASGASKIYIENLTQDYVDNYIFPTLKAGAVYETKYLLGTATARPCIAKRLVEIAKAEGAEAICHGCTGKGNDQVRFELTIMALAPEMKIIAPWRIWDIKSREEAIDYAEKRGIPLPVTKKNLYSMDRNIWHLSHEGMDLEDPWNEHQKELYHIVTAPEDAPDKAEYVTIDFEKGMPVAIDGKKMGSVELLTLLNEMGARNGVGIDDLVENRLVGIKSRGVYENPGGRILYTAHNDLEYLCLDRDTYHYKQLVSQRYAELVYYGQWFSPLREALDAFVNDTQKTVTGTVKIKLYKGNCTIAGSKSPYSLYDTNIASFTMDEELYDHKDAEGFINCFGLPLKTRALKLKK
ncbi:argininosuccinate synthase [endosymbiont 'TC1' of Trimyema compressum]|uniref:argininosuccinate synthase n=1 Tax=endosymbiont 'TC1' of Trimyema compressum TaxID=243899 RepID=UPI0007F0F580|nr:argininosuccinate synthase [endosymbiont 'TC1' of Trimyema compressum]AMP21191.1 argininosuccinate synthase [endosymbiont 'TC1' of Trimyema compressum]